MRVASMYSKANKTNKFDYALRAASMYSEKKQKNK